MKELSFWGMLQDQFGDADVVPFVGHHGGRCLLNGFCISRGWAISTRLCFKNIKEYVVGGKLKEAETLAGQGRGLIAEALKRCWRPPIPKIGRKWTMC
jgi:hypothetical protein